MKLESLNKLTEALSEDAPAKIIARRLNSAVKELYNSEELPENIKEAIDEINRAWSYLDKQNKTSDELTENIRAAAAKHDLADHFKKIIGENDMPDQKPEQPEDNPTKDQPTGKPSGREPISKKLGAIKGPAANAPLVQIMYQLGDITLVRIKGNQIRELGGEKISVPKLAYITVPTELIRDAIKQGNKERAIWNWVRENKYLDYLNKIADILRDYGVENEKLKDPKYVHKAIEELNKNDDVREKLENAKKDYTSKFSYSASEAIDTAHQQIQDNEHPDDFTKYLKDYVGSTSFTALFKAFNRAQKSQPKSADNRILNYLLRMNGEQKNRLIRALDKSVRKLPSFNKQNVQKYLNYVYQRWEDGLPVVAEELIREGFFDWLKSDPGMPREVDYDFDEADMKLAQKGLANSYMVVRLRNHPEIVEKFAKKFGITPEFQEQPKTRPEQPEPEQPQDQPDQETEKEYQREARSILQGFNRNWQRYRLWLLKPSNKEAFIRQSNIEGTEIEDSLNKFIKNPKRFLRGIDKSPDSPDFRLIKQFEDFSKEAQKRQRLAPAKEKFEKAKRRADPEKIEKAKEARIRRTTAGGEGSPMTQKRASPQRVGEFQDWLKSRKKTSSEGFNQLDLAINEALEEYNIIPDRIIELNRDAYLDIIKKNPEIEEYRMHAYRVAHEALESHSNNNDPKLTNLLIENASRAFSEYESLLIDHNLNEFVKIDPAGTDAFSELAKYSCLTCSPKTEQGWKVLTEFHKNPQKRTRQMKNNIAWIRGPSKIN